MARSKILDRIRKLLALAQSSNVNEAAVAAAQAQKLIAKHRINQARELVDAPESEGIALDDDPLDEGARVAQWRLELAMVVAEANGCRVVVLKDGRYSTIKLVGDDEDIDIVRALYTWLTKEVQRLARASGLKGCDHLNSYRMGTITTIEQRLADANEEARKIGLKDARKVGKKSTALVRVGLQSLAKRGEDAERIVDEITEGREESIGEFGEYDIEAWVTGAALGNTMDLHGHQTKLNS